MDSGNLTVGCSTLEEVVKRFVELEVSQARIRAQLQVMLEHEEERRRRRALSHALRRRRQMIMATSGGSLSSERPIPGFFPAGRFADGPFSSVLRHIGQALHVCRSDTGEIIFWNQSAEDLYGWKDEEALGKREEDLLLHGESEPDLGEIMEHYASSGQPWSGRLPLKRRTGEILPAMVTKAPLFDDEGGTVFGVITVAIDAALLLPHNQRNNMLISDADPKGFSRSRSYGDVEHQISQVADDKPNKHGLTDVIANK